MKCDTSLANPLWPPCSEAARVLVTSTERSIPQIMRREPDILRYLNNMSAIDIAICAIGGGRSVGPLSPQLLNFPYHPSETESTVESKLVNSQWSCEEKANFVEPPSLCKICPWPSPRGSRKTALRSSSVQELLHNIQILQTIDFWLCDAMPSMTEVGLDFFHL